MESIPARHLICATYNNSSFLIRYPSFPLTRIRLPNTHNPFVLCSRKSVFQDFQGYANPSRLLPAKEPKVCTDSSLEKVLQSFKVGGSECLYKVKLQTSNIYGSGLSDVNAGILLCLIDENGDSILQRIPASSIKDHTDQSADKHVSDEVLHFHRGSVDEFTFEGPKLGKLGALWISLESGQWRLGGVGLIVLCRNKPTSEANEYLISEYRFEVEDTLLGEGSDISMSELRPSLVKDFSGDNLSMLSENFLQPTTLVSNDGSSSNEESMKEYAELKLSLLLYDALLVLAGSSVASFSAGENAALAFLYGGIGGFLYLLLLQGSVDGLPAPALASMNSSEKSDKIFRRLMKGPLWSLVLAFTLSVVAVKYGSGDGIVAALTPKELLSGMLGFLACKVAVVLAALKPLPMSLEQNK